jgi:hypothetical protein
MVEGNTGFATAALKLIITPSDALEFKGLETTGYLLDGAIVVPDPPESLPIFLVMVPENSTDDGQLFDMIFKIGEDVADGTDVTIELALRYGNADDFAAVDPDDPENVIYVDVAFESGTLAVEEELLTPTADDLVYATPPWNVTYNGSPQGVAVTPNAGIGAVTVYYTGIDPTVYPKSTTAPTNAGSYTVSVNIAASPGYEAAANIDLGIMTINKAAAPTIVWPTTTPIKYTASALSTVALNGGSTEHGTFAWTDGSTIPTVPGGSYGVTFTPTYDTANYELPASSTNNVALVVNKGDAPTIVWPTAATTIRQGQQLSVSVLSGGSTEYGTFAWTNGTSEPTTSGNQEVTFTPTYDTANYELPASMTAEVRVTVVIPGDIDGNGNTSAADALLALRAAVGHITLTGDRLIAADLDDDGVVTSAEVILIARRALGL